VYIAILSGEKAADALNRVMRAPERKAREFANYERRIHRVMDLYLNSILAGDDRGLFQVRWRIWVFHLLVFLQGKFKVIAPKMNFEPTP
jgi:hypothetical protein